MQNAYKNGYNLLVVFQSSIWFYMQVVLSLDSTKVTGVNLVPRVYSAFKMAAEGGEDPGLYQYNTHTDWFEDVDILTLVVIG